MKKRIWKIATLVALAVPGQLQAQENVPGSWFSWRGPQQDGTSLETGLVDSIEVDGEGQLWSYPLAGGGTPVIGGGRVYAFGYEGEGQDLQEVLVCLDEKTGAKIWDRRWNDFLSDSVYTRYAIGSPTIDAETGNVFVMGTPGLLMCYSPTGDLLWTRCLFSEFGRLTFPNGRTGSIVIEGDLAITHFISTSWGPQAPARDRFYAFDKKTGQVVWTATPGGSPLDGSFSRPYVFDHDGRRLLAAGTGCGRMACLDARTGDVVWVYQVSTGGVNSSVVPHGDDLIVIHGKENLDSSTIGRMLSIPRFMAAVGDGPALIESTDETWKARERWRNDLVAFTSSPVIVGDRIYQTVATGALCCVDAETGKVLWEHKLAPDQIHASPVAADGKLYVPMTNGTFHIVKPTDEGVEVLDEDQLAGKCLGAPAIAGGRIYVHTTERLYCFGDPDKVKLPPAPEAAGPIFPKTPVRLQIIPGDEILRPGQTIALRVRGIDPLGNGVELVTNPEWTGSPRLDVSIDEEGVLTAGSRPGVGTITASTHELSGTARIRIVPALPYAEDFESFEFEQRPGEEEATFANPPPFWFGGTKKWEVVALDGNKVLAKTLDITLFQRAFTLFGQPDASNYTAKVDIMSDGNRRTMSTAGLLNQRYLILLKGNHQEIEISSNMERIKVSVPFAWKPQVWYTLKTRVDVADDGSGVVRAKAWKRGDAEPKEWNIEVPHKIAHTEGSPGLFGFAPQSRFRVYVDNLSVTPND